MAGPMIHGAMDVSEYGYVGQVLRMQEMLGVCLLDYSELKDLAVDALKQLFSTYIEYVAFGKAEIKYTELNGYSPEHAVQLIYDIDPSYEDPFGITKKLRKNETFITCPVCGKSIRERDAKCPQCGTSKEEIQRLIKDNQAKEAAERERLRKEREEKEAEEVRIRAEKAAEKARIRTEKRAEWWKQNRKNVLIALAVIIFAFCLGFVYRIIVNNSLEKKIVATFEAGDQCVNAYDFKEAEKFYKHALEIDDSENTRNRVSQRISHAKEVKQIADEEYERELKKLRILLDADDNVFNQYSNECLLKMEQIYPEREETKYYKRLSTDAYSSATIIKN